jgi:hypothetical protein
METEKGEAMKFDLTGKAGFPAAVAVDSHNLCSKLKSSQRYLKFWDKEKIRKNCVSRKDAKAPRFGEIDNKSFFASLAAWRDNIFCHFSLENKMLETNSQTSECKKLRWSPSKQVLFNLGGE